MAAININFPQYAGKMLLIGAGSLGQGLLPLLVAHAHVPVDRIIVLSADERGSDVTAKYGVRHIIARMRVPVRCLQPCKVL